MSKLELFNGIVELVKAGYKPSDVKDLLESLKTDPDLEQKGGSDLKDNPEESKKQPEKKEPEKKEDSFDALAEIIKRESEGK
jgi:hypothetical protein